MRLRLASLEVPGLAPVSLELDPAECVGLSGPSGSGKSRLLRAIADLDPHAGEAYLGDVACSAIAAPQWRRQVGLLGAESAWWRDTAGEHFAAGADPPLAALHLPADVLRRPLAELSTGQRQRLALLRLLQNRPAALLLDEPTAALDDDNVARVETLVAQYRTEHGAPVLWVSHDVAQLERVARRRLELRAGALHE